MEYKIQNDKTFSLCIALYYFLFVLDKAICLFFGETIIWVYFERIIVCLILATLVYKIFETKKSIIFFLVLELIFGCFFLISVIKDNFGDINWISIYVKIVVINIPLAAGAYSIRDKSELIKILYSISIVSVPIMVVTAIIGYSRFESTYDMNLGYLMAFSALNILGHFVISHKWQDILIVFILCLLILFVGSRGPFICLLSFSFFEVFLSKQFDYRKKLFFCMILCILIVVLLCLKNDLIQYLLRTSEELGFGSRSLVFLMNGEAVTHDSGRIQIYSYYLDLIKNNPIWGYGVVGMWIAEGWYPHNIVLDIILSFGYPFGVALLLVILIIAFKVIRCSDSYVGIASLIFLSYSMMLMVSSSYLMLWQFFVFIGLGVSCFGQNGKSNCMKFNSIKEEESGT